MIKPSEGRMNQLRREMGQDVPQPILTPAQYLKRLLMDQLDLAGNVVEDIISFIGGHEYGDTRHLLKVLSLYDLGNKEVSNVVCIYEAWLDTNYRARYPMGRFPKSRDGDAIESLFEKAEEAKKVRLSTIPRRFLNADQTIKGSRTST